MLVKDDALDLEDEEAILEAVTWGAIYSVTPDELSQVAEDQSVEAMKTGGPQIIPNPSETFDNPRDISIAFSDLPSNL